MDKNKVYIVDDGSMSREQLAEIFEYLKKNGEKLPEVLTPEQLEMLRHPPMFEEEKKPFIFTNPYAKLKQIDSFSTRSVPQYIRPEKKINNNDPCPCGSGKKYKKCCINKG